MSLKASVSAPSSSREVTGSVTEKSPAATARVPCISRTIGRARAGGQPDRATDADREHRQRDDEGPRAGADAASRSPPG